jgi:hypothetical protein
MLVVEMSSTGAEILCRIVPLKDCLVVRLRWGIDSEMEEFLLAPLFRVVKALERDIAVLVCCDISI